MDNLKKIPLLATGITGLVGSKFVQLYKDQYEIQNLDLNHPSSPTNITNLDQVLSTVSASAAKTLIHLAAFTNVSAAYEQKNDKTGPAYQTNVIGTKNIVEACRQTNKHLIHISTAYIFDGEIDGLYKETDLPNPIEWYGQTKWEAEQIVNNSDINWTILRIDQPFRSDEYQRLDVVRKIISGLSSGSLPPQFTNQFFGPTYIDDFAKILNFFISSKNQGTYHASSGEKWSPYDFALAIKKAQHLKGQIKPGDLNDYLKHLNRPYQKNTAMDISKLRQIIDFELTPIKTALTQV